MSRTFAALMGKQVVVITALTVGLLCVIAAVFLVVSFRVGGAPSWVGWILRGVGLVLAGGAALSLCLRYTSYTLSEAGLEIRRIGGRATYTLAELETAEVRPGALGGALRTFGNGGLWSFSGHFKSRALGSFRAFVSDPRRTVVLGLAGGSKIVVSPDEPEEFVQTFHRLKSGS